jgi:hypothetical protein
MEAFVNTVPYHNRQEISWPAEQFFIEDPALERVNLLNEPVDQPTKWKFIHLYIHANS